MVTLNHGLECQMQRWLIEGSSWLLTAVMKADRSCYFVAGLVIVGIIGGLCIKKIYNDLIIQVIINCHVIQINIIIMQCSMIFIYTSVRIYRKHGSLQCNRSFNYLSHDTN